jgi:cytochrome c-type biogenesis protein CcmE
MKARHKRFMWIAVGLAIIAVAVTLVLRAFNSNLVFFFTPTEVAEQRSHLSSRWFGHGRQLGAHCRWAHGKV